MVGEIILSEALFIPDKYFICDGRTLLIDDYEDLYGVIGTTYGGNGTTNFKLPNIDLISDIKQYIIRYEL